MLRFSSFITGAFLIVTSLAQDAYNASVAPDGGLKWCGEQRYNETKVGWPLSLFPS
jgi:hypothetical protein